MEPALSTAKNEAYDDTRRRPIVIHPTIGRQPIPSLGDLDPPGERGGRPSCPQRSGTARRRLRIGSYLAMLAYCLVRSVCAQELEPRVYSPNPVGINFVLVAYGRSQGQVLFDPSVPVQNVESTLNVAGLGYGATFGAWGHLASASLAVPFVSGTVSGEVGGGQSEIERTGLADVSLRLGLNLFGIPALSPAEFAQHPAQTALGASLVIVAPTGDYDSSRLINLGTNRWAFKPELGLSYPIGHWFLEAYGGIWFFTTNTEYYGDTQRSEQPLASFQAHVSYTFRRGLWLAADATYYRGGQTSVDGRDQDDRQANTRIGLTLAVPVTQHQSIKLAWSDGVVVRFGGSFNTLTLAWQYAWFD